MSINRKLDDSALEGATFQIDSDAVVSKGFG